MTRCFARPCAGCTRDAVDRPARHDARRPLGISIFNYEARIDGIFWDPILRIEQMSIALLASYRTNLRIPPLSGGLRKDGGKLRTWMDSPHPQFRGGAARNSVRNALSVISARSCGEPVRSPSRDRSGQRIGDPSAGTEQLKRPVVEHGVHLFDVRSLHDGADEWRGDAWNSLPIANISTGWS